MKKMKFIAVFLLVLTGGLAYFVYSSENGGWGKEYPFLYGLDLSGGVHLVYEADTSVIKEGGREAKDAAMSSLKDNIERRINIFGVAEPIIQVEKGGLSGDKDRLIVELPGLDDIDEAIKRIGVTPKLEFKLFNEEKLKQAQEVELKPDADGKVKLDIDPYIETGLDGSLVKKAMYDTDNLGQPAVRLTFNAEGKKLFGEITKANLNKPFAILLDGVAISSPVIRDEILDGTAIISGNFTKESAKKLVDDLNFGALPVPVHLLSSQKISASLGADVLNKGVQAGLIGLLLVAIFLVLWYRLPGLVAVLSLTLYVVMMLVIFKLGVVLTAAGIAGFIMSIGMAVDANVLIFERMKEEIQAGRNLEDAVREGFVRAWPSIRDANISSLITAIILFWVGTSLVKGFALTFGIGILVSMITAITVTKNYLLAIAQGKAEGLKKFLFGCGINFNK